MTRNPLKRRIVEGRPTIGAWSMSGSPAIVEAMSHAGYDFVVICLEHGPGDTTDLGNLLRACQCGGAEPLVRVPWNDPVMLKRVLDLGARSLLIPMIETGEEARRAATACLYPPRGTRGYAAGVVRASRYGFEADYAMRAHEDLFVCVQIESERGVANAAGIAAAEGVDLVFIGPNDLAGSLGHIERMDHPDVVAAIETVERAARAAGKPLGTVPWPGHDASALAARGYALVAGAADMAFVRLGAAEDLARHRAAFGERA
jgi:4-hydroxy-2-oxoheptanedioate aldolase